MVARALALPLNGLPSIKHYSTVNASLPGIASARAPSDFFRACIALPPNAWQPNSFFNGFNRNSHHLPNLLPSTAINNSACVKLGYFQDDFAHHFVRRGGVNKRCPPLINRGYYARVAAIRRMLDAFLAENFTSHSNDPHSNIDSSTAADAAPASQQQQQRQVVSIGAGFDTTYFRLRNEGRAPVRYIELDYREVMHKKAAAINGVEELRGLCVVGRCRLTPVLTPG